MYSQHNEEKIITEFFGKTVGRFLDIGAYDGVSFSNTRRLFELGWGGTCVEASPQCFVALQTLYKDVDRVKLVCGAVSDHVDCSLFYDNGGAVATTSKEHMSQWNKDQAFSEIYVSAITPDTLLQKLPGPYDFVSIDIEADTIPVLCVFPPLKSLGIKLLCIEAVTVAEKEAVSKIMAARGGYVLHSSTVLNLLFMESL